MERASAIFSNSPRHFHRSWNGSDAKAWYCHINNISMGQQHDILRSVETPVRKPWLATF